MRLFKISLFISLFTAGCSKAQQISNDSPIPWGSLRPQQKAAPSNFLDFSYKNFTLAFSSQPSNLGGPYAAPPLSHYYYIMRNLNIAQIANLQEFAMFLAHVIQETSGVNFKELDCQCQNYGQCTWAEPSTGPGCYCGRGALQLSFPCNYAKASQELYGDNRLLDSPETAATSIPDIWGTAFWYWSAVVRATSNGASSFDATTKAINGRCECASVQGDCYGSPKKTEDALKRCNLYQNIAATWGLKAEQCGQC